VPAGLPPGRRAAAPPRPRLRASFLAASAALVVVAALAGWAGHHVRADAPSTLRPAAPRSIELGPVALSAPGAWTPARVQVPGLPDRGPRTATYAPTPGLSARAVLTLAPLGDATLLPKPLRALAGTARPRRSTIAGLPAWKYQPLELHDGRMAQVTVAPTTAGSLTVLCVAPKLSWSGAVGCADELADGSLEGATPLAPSRSLAFRQQLVPVIAALGDRRATLRTSLRRASTPRGQARFAARLGRTYERAAARLAPRAIGSDGSKRLVTTLERTARAYRRLSLAAARRQPVRSRRSAAAIRRADRALKRAVAGAR